VSPSTRQGTLPEGEKLRKAPGGPKGISFSSKSMPSYFINTQGRRDHDE
jgi:hypothetical protein